MIEGNPESPDKRAKLPPISAKATHHNPDVEITFKPTGYETNPLNHAKFDGSSETKDNPLFPAPAAKFALPPGFLDHNENGHNTRTQNNSMNFNPNPYDAVGMSMAARNGQPQMMATQNNPRYPVLPPSELYNVNSQPQQQYENNFNGSTPADLESKLSQTNRIGFIRKVYSILTVQLLITAIFTSICLASVGMQEFMVRNPSLMGICIVVYMISMYTLVCYPKVSRAVPWNYLLLFLFTAAMSYLVGFISSQYSPRIVAAAAILTALMMIGLTAYACYTKTDFTMCGGLLFAAGFILIGMIFVGIFITNKFYHSLLCGMTLVLLSVYVIYDTQLIVGKHSYKYMIDDYILAALNLYLDIINMFLTLLKILGKAAGK